MKRIFILTLLCFYVSLFAQLDRSKIPQPGPAPAVAFPDYELVKTKNGIRLILVKNDELPTITIRLLIDNDPVLEKEYAGLLDITGSMLRTGTKSRTKEQLDDEIDFIGASINSGNTFVYANGLSKYTEKILELMSDIVINPSFPNDELEKLKEQTISGIKFRKTEPNSLVSLLRKKVLFGNDHPYGDVETEETISRITRDKCLEFYETYFKPNYAIIAVVGNFDRGQIINLIERYFGNWKPGTLPKPKYRTPENPKTVEVDLIDRASSVQSVLSVCQLVDLKPNSPDVVKAKLMNTILGGGVFRLFMNLREKHSFTYGAYSSLDDDNLIGQFSAETSVRNSATDSAITEIFYEIKRIRNEKVEKKELSMAKNYTSGNFVLSLESPNTIASYAIDIEKNKLPKDYYKTYLKKVEAVTSDDILKMAKKYLNPDRMRIVLVGNAKEISDKLSKFGKINYYDEDGNPIKESKDQKVDLTADEIIAKYIEKTGGKEKYQKLNSISTKLSGKMQVFDFKIDVVQKAPNKFYQKVSVPGMFENITVFENKKGWTKQNNQLIDLGEEEVSSQRNKVIFNFYLNYKNDNIKAELSGIKQIKGKDYYELKFYDNDKLINTEYFGKDDFLKYREVMLQKTPQGELELSIDYTDYKDYDGILMPAKWIQNMMGQSIELNVEKIEFNNNVDDSLFVKP